MSRPRTSRPNRAPIRVLVVEDVDQMRELIKLVLSGTLELSVSGLARNGAEARIELHRRRPDLVLLDEILPGESSVDLLAELGAVDMPVLLLTGLVDRDAPLPPGALGRLLKPGWESLEQDRARFVEAIQKAVDAFRRNC